MSEKRYVVAAGKSVYTKRDRHVLEGQEVVIGLDLPPGRLEEFLRQKIVVEVGAEPVLAKEEALPAIPADVSTDEKKEKQGKPSPLASEVSKKVTTAAIQAQEEVKALQKAKADPLVRAAAPISPWVLDPKKLEKRTLPELNVMIRERDPKAKTFEKVEEAVAFLSQDFDKQFAKA